MNERIQPRWWDVMFKFYLQNVYQFPLTSFSSLLFSFRFNPSLPLISLELQEQASAFWAALCGDPVGENWGSTRANRQVGTQALCPNWVLTTPTWMSVGANPLQFNLSWDLSPSPWDTLGQSESPSYDVARFQIHRNYEMLNICSFCCKVWKQCQGCFSFCI